MVGEECEVGWGMGGEGWRWVGMGGKGGRWWWWLDRPPQTAVERDEDEGICEVG